MSESLTQSKIPVNNVYNINTTNTHLFKIEIDNRKSDKIEVNIGGSIQISNSKYSIDKQLSNIARIYTSNASIGYKVTDRLYLNTHFEVSHYQSQNFSTPLTIPILNAEISQSFLKNKRAIISIRAFDLLNRNISIFQAGQDNYFADQRSNIIGRFYVGLSWCSLRTLFIHRRRPVDFGHGFGRHFDRFNQRFEAEPRGIHQNSRVGFELSGRKSQ